jgi:hypothetical protein
VCVVCVCVCVLVHLKHNQNLNMVRVILPGGQKWIWIPIEMVAATIFVACALVLTATVVRASEAMQVHFPVECHMNLVALA